MAVQSKITFHKVTFHFFPLLEMAGKSKILSVIYDWMVEQGRKEIAKLIKKDKKLGEP